jgi:DNA helicase HerA-like ATPase
MNEQERKDPRLDKDKIDLVRDELRTLVGYLEERANLSVAQVAYSIDGRIFNYEAPLTLSIPVGSHVHLTIDTGEEYLGQIITKDIIQSEGAEISYDIDEKYQDALPEGLKNAGTRGRLRLRSLAGRGVLLARIVDQAFIDTSNTDAFRSATISLADSSLVDRYLADAGRKRAALPVGKALYVEGEASVQLDAGGFNRHTFLCGQSGSGKTFSLGIVLEQILLETDLRIVIIDPNSDFVHLNRLRPLDEVNRFRSKPFSPDTYARLAEHFQKTVAGLHVFRPSSLVDHSDHALRVRFSDLSQPEQGTVLELDPLDDREEYNSFWNIAEGFGRQDYSWEDVRQAIGGDYTSAARLLGLRIANLRVPDWEVWCSPGEPSLIDTLESDDWRCLVLDIGTLGSQIEKSVITNAVLNYFWRQRNQRQPTLIVIDEAHNICPQEPTDAMQTISTEQIIRVAGEGRKFGLYLLLSTQRPSKIHSNILSQCDNLMLMRMNSTADVNHLAGVLSHIPASLMEQATKFSLGESLLAGRIVKNPVFAKFEGRLSEEGGSDIPTTWATPGDKD